MRQRELIIGLSVVSSVFACNNGDVQPAKAIQNVVVIVADDHALHVTGKYGNGIIRTPNIDKIADEGVWFSNAYCNSPICSASRQSVLTGKYPHATGVNLLFTPFPDEGNLTIAEYLREKGYATALVGKSHFNNGFWSSLYKEGVPDHGFDVRTEGDSYRQYLRETSPPQPSGDSGFYNKGMIPADSIAEWMNSRNLPHAVYDEYSSGTYYARQAARFIEDNSHKPFFLWVAFFEPHHPYYYPVEYEGTYDPADMPLPEGSPEDDRWVPAKFRMLTDEQKRGIIAAYYTSVEYMDKNTGIVLDALKDNGLDENTLVLYLSDNGYLLNNHKRFEKHTLWEEAINQPLIIKAGSSTKRGIRKDALVEYIDVMPTILDLVGMPVPPEVQGRSFKPVLFNQDDIHRELAFAEYLEDNSAMICNRKWKYIFTTGSRDLGIGYATGNGPSGIVHRLYNLENDPQESNDVSADHPDVLNELQQQMLNRFIETHPDSHNLPDNLTTEGKLVWFCEPRDVGTDQSPLDNPVRVFKNNQ